MTRTNNSNELPEPTSPISSQEVAFFLWELDQILKGKWGCLFCLNDFVCFERLELDIVSDAITVTNISINMKYVLSLVPLCLSSHRYATLSSQLLFFCPVSSFLQCPFLLPFIHFILFNCSFNFLSPLNAAQKE